jgi:rsbT co-antagonist protein RsbR
MNDQLQGATQSLMREMGLNEGAIERRKKIVGLEPADLERIASIKDVVESHVEEFAGEFFKHLTALEEARPLLTNRASLERARELKKKHLLAMVAGDYGAKYVEERIDMGCLYATAGLDTRVFLAAFHQVLKSVGAAVIKRFERAPLDGFESFMSLKKVAFFDIALIIDVLIFERERLIRRQEEAIRELSTPVLQVRQGLLMIPVIGLIDSYRASLITEGMLRAIRKTRARVVVMDVTGVATIDSRVANHILQTVTAARLMGAQIIVTGLSSDVAQSLAALGIELSKLITVADLQGGLERAERLLGYRVTLARAG